MRHPPTNDWHYVTISQDKDGVYKWTNRAGVTWTLYHESDDNTLRVGDDCPYYISPYNYRTATFNETGIVGPYTGLEFYSYESGESRESL